MIIAIMKKILFCSLFFISTALLLLPRWIERKFGHISFEPIEFALRTSWAGVDMNIVSSFVRNVVLTPLAILIFLLLVLRLASRHGNIGRFLSRFRPAWCILIYVSLAAAPLIVKYDLLDYLTSSGSTFIEEHYTAVKFEDVEFPAVKKNLVLIVAESLENTFNDPDLFNPILMPELLELQKGNVSFAGQRQLPGTGWTIAGITAYLFGLPLKLPVAKHSYENLSTFMPNANSILDVLSQGGYDIHVFLGTDVRFAEEDNLLKTHAPGAQIHDFLYFQERGAKRENGWGVSDYYVLERAREYLDDAEGKGNRKPFLLIIKTIDTHANFYYVRDGDPRKFGDARDSFMNSSRMISDFISWVKGKGFFENTAIVVLGDHWLMKEHLAGVRLADEADKRSVFNLFINASGADDTIRDRPGERLFSSLDMAPTILDSIGVKLKKPRFGLGSSLFGKGPTLLEEYGYEYVSHELKQKSLFYNELWNF